MGASETSGNDPWIHVHVPKTGGTSLRRALPGHGYLRKSTPHLEAVELRKLVGEVAWDYCFTFGFVRNPWDRFVSFWVFSNHYLPEKHGHPRLTPEQQYASFKPWLRRELVKIQTQEDILAFDDDPLVHFVGRFERFVADTMFVFGQTGTSWPKGGIPNVNPGTRERDWRPYYDDELAQAVALREEWVCRRFGYTFDK